jgi:hypothetical protein
MEFAREIDSGRASRAVGTLQNLAEFARAIEERGSPAGAGECGCALPLFIRPKLAPSRQCRRLIASSRAAV